MQVYKAVLRILITPIMQRLDQILDSQQRIERRLMALADQVTQLQTAVADVKQASDDEAVRVDSIIAALQAGASDNPAVAQAIVDLGETAAKLRAFHANQPAA
jgi:formiminotetrahydrofolate cyclodeaminase